ncbi:hypothetical protein VNO80_06751 [Phaseolus coccineus]|uniref:Uncharacterized protein n=1 Tax=Phaseolus coccineus TaxID=3886 RepID=A0AAN9NIJ4_PHACN
MISRVRFQEADSDGSLRGWIGGSRGLVGRRPILCILNDLGDNVVQIRAIPVLRPDRRVYNVNLCAIRVFHLRPNEPIFE